MDDDVAPTQRDTRARLLDAAEQVLLEHGVSGLSLARVTTAAGMNPAAVNYTFGSKELLLRALLRRLLEPVTAERIRRFDVLAPAHTVEDVVRAFLEPLLEMQEQVGPLFAELMVKPTFQGDDRLRQAGATELRLGVDRLLDALGPLLPHHPRHTLLSRIELMLGTAFMHTVRKGWLTQTADGPPDQHAAVDELITFTTAGLTTP